METIKVRLFVDGNDADEFSDILFRFGLAEGQYTRDELETIWYGEAEDDVLEAYYKISSFEKFFEFDSFDEFNDFYNEVAELANPGLHYDYAGVDMRPDVNNRCLEMTIVGYFRG